MSTPGPKPVHGERKDVLVRFPLGLLARVESYGSGRGVASRNDAIIQLIERGLSGDGPNQVLLPTGPGPSPLAPIPDEAIKRVAAGWLAAVETVPTPVTHVKEVVVPRRTRAAHVVSGAPAKESAHKVQFGPTSRKAAGGVSSVAGLSLQEGRVYKPAGQTRAGNDAVWRRMFGKGKEGSE